MSNSEPSAIVLQGIAGIGGLYRRFDSSGENGLLTASVWIHKLDTRLLTIFLNPMEADALSVS